ncbi:DUF4229 domain-containing protein [Nonomuraea sp. NPDC050556]|uniref:DUF4229 domain-containing protein n=1 Tax=Nonomuraea sp. NPDC050556 TaxID=3364369 RepID=UPI0037B14E60
MRPALVYTASRIGLFLVALGVFYLLTLRGFLLFAAAFVASGVASYVLLTKQRDAVSSRISNKIDQPKPEGD